MSGFIAVGEVVVQFLPLPPPLSNTHRGLFIIDAKGILRQITMNDLPVSCSGCYCKHLISSIGKCTGIIITCLCNYCWYCDCPLQVGRSVDETLRLVQAFQYTDHKGEGTYAPSHGSPLSSPRTLTHLQY